MSPTPALNAALAKLQADLPKVAKSKTAEVPTKAGGKYSYTYADLAAVSDVIMPKLGECGLSFTARPTVVDSGRLVLAYELRHESGEEIGGFYPLNGSGGPQQVGGEITYARRYALCSVTGVAPEDDDDAAAAQSQPTTQRRRQAQQQDGEPAAPARTAQRSARTAEPPLPGESGYDRTGGPAMISAAQTRALMAAFRDAGLGGNDERDARLARASAVVGRTLGSSAEMTVSEASKVIEDVKKYGASRIDRSDDPSAETPPGTTWDPELQEYIPDNVGVQPASAGAQ